MVEIKPGSGNNWLLRLLGTAYQGAASDSATIKSE